jgi:P4 family phage/plasmid primase-like protien
MSSQLLFDFLKDCYVESLFSSHVSLTNPKGNFLINRESSDKLFNIFQKVLKDEGEDLILGLAEKPTNYLPVLSDIDIAKDDEEIKDYKINTNKLGYKHIYTEKNKKDVIQVYQSVLRTIVDECTDEHLICVVLEKPMYNIINKKGKKVWKSGLHLQFPYCFLSKNEQETHLLPRVKDAIRELNIFENLNVEDSSSLIDGSYLTVPWLLYGCRKDGENMRPYKVTEVYDSECNLINLEEAFRYYQIYDVKEEPINIAGNVEENLPRILSTLPYGRECCELKDRLPSPKKETNFNKIKEKTKTREFDNCNLKNNLEEAKILLPMLADFRTQDRNEWMNIGWLLYNIGNGCNEALELWIEFSSRDEDKFDENECISAWEKMTLKDMSIASLHYYAKLDNEQLYKQYKKDRTFDLINQSCEGSHYDIAKILYFEYSTEFVCASTTNNIWYQFKNHKWEEIEGGVYLRENISKEIADIYGKYGAMLFEKCAKADKIEETIYQNSINRTKKMVANLKNSSYKNSVMQEAREIFYDRNFKNKLDTNAYLIAFKNGVYDLKNNHFRSGRPDDYLSKSMPINYINFNKDDPRVKEVNEYLEKVFPDISVRNYFLDTTSDVFVGGNHQKVGIFWTGDGDNGKSVTQTIIEKMLGPYAIKISTTLLTGKKANIGATSPELARTAGGVRWIVFEEPDKGEEINNGIFKSLTGNDTYFARDLFEKGKSTSEINPLFMTIFICNGLPRFKGGGDKAVWNRVKVVPYESTFVREGFPCPETYEEQLLEKRFPMDTEFSSKIPKLLEPFAWVLLEHRKKIQGKTRVEPEKVKMATETYRKKNDIYRQFVDECIVEDNGYLSILDLFNAFKEWYKMGFGSITCPTKNDVQEYFTKLWNEPEKGIKWYGYRIRSIEEEIENGLAIKLTDEDLIDYSDTASVRSNISKKSL